MAKQVKIVFTRGKAYAGKDYHAGDVAQVEESWARRFLANGSARLAPDAAPLGELPPLGTVADQVSHADPSPTRRRGRRE